MYNRYQNIKNCKIQIPALRKKKKKKYGKNCFISITVKVHMQNV